MEGEKSLCRQALSIGFGNKKKAPLRLFLYWMCFRKSALVVLLVDFLSAVRAPKSVNFADVACCNESVDVVGVDEVHQARKLLFGQQAFQLDGSFLGVAADDII